MVQVQVEGCGHLCGLQATRTLSLTLMGVESSCFNIWRTTFSGILSKKSQCPLKKQERDGGCTYSGSLVVNTLHCTPCIVQACLTGFVGRSFSNHSLASSGLSGCSVTDALRSRTKFGDRRKRPCSAVVVLVQQPFSSNPRIIGPSNGGFEPV